MPAHNFPELFDDLNAEDLAGAERVSNRRQAEAIAQYRLETAKLREIRRVRSERAAEATK